MCSRAEDADNFYLQSGERFEMIQPIYFNRSNVIYVQISENIEVQNDIVETRCKVSLKLVKITLTVRMSRQERF